MFLNRSSTASVSTVIRRNKPMICAARRPSPLPARARSTEIVLSALLLLLIGSVTTTVMVQAQSQCGGFAPPAVIRGTKFFNSITGEYMPIKGINYYPRPNTGELAQTNSIDFFTDDYSYLWEPDIAHFQELNINVVRVYAVQPGVPHDGFMCALRAAGIYLIVGLAADCENCAITRDAAPACYPPELKARGQFIIAEFSRYDNVLAFEAGNEISLNAASLVDNAPCQKKFIRDMRAFIQSCDATIRAIPVGLAIADTDRADNVLWYNCRSDPADELENADFIGLNAYLHCDGTLTDYTNLPGFVALLSDFQTYETTVPVMLSEFGCISPSFPTIGEYQAQRNFLQIDTLFSEPYREKFVGGAVFEYSTELINSNSPYPFTEFGEGQFGIGYLTPQECDDIDIPCVFEPFPQFYTLAAKYSAVDTSSELSLSEYEASLTEMVPPSCPAIFPALSSFTWSSDAVEDRECPGVVYAQCSAIPIACTNLGVRATPSLDANGVPTGAPVSDIVSPTVPATPSASVFAAAPTPASAAAPSNASNTTTTVSAPAAPTPESSSPGNISSPTVAPPVAMTEEMPTSSPLEATIGFEGSPTLKPSPESPDLKAASTDKPAQVTFFETPAPTMGKSAAVPRQNTRFLPVMLSASALTISLLLLR